MTWQHRSNSSIQSENENNLHCSILLKKTACKLLLVEWSILILGDNLQQWKLARLFKVWFLLGCIISCWFPTLTCCGLWSLMSCWEISPAMQETEVSIWLLARQWEHNSLFWCHLKTMSLGQAHTFRLSKTKMLPVPLCRRFYFDY